MFKRLLSNKKVLGLLALIFFSVFSLSYFSFFRVQNITSPVYALIDRIRTDAIYARRPTEEQRNLIQENSSAEELSYYSYDTYSEENGISYVVLQVNRNALKTGLLIESDILVTIKLRNIDRVMNKKLYSLVELADPAIEFYKDIEALNFPTIFFGELKENINTFLFQVLPEEDFREKDDLEFILSKKNIRLETLLSQQLYYNEIYDSNYVADGKFLRNIDLEFVGSKSILLNSMSIIPIIMSLITLINIYSYSLAKWRKEIMIRKVYFSSSFKLKFQLFRELYVFSSVILLICATIFYLALAIELFMIFAISVLTGLIINALLIFLMIQKGLRSILKGGNIYDR